MIEEFGGHVVSSVTGQGIAELIGMLRVAVEAGAGRTRLSRRRTSCIGPLRRASGSNGTIRGRSRCSAATRSRAVDVSDLTNPEALDYVHDRLSSLGVDKALARAGRAQRRHGHGSASSPSNTKRRTPSTSWTRLVGDRRCVKIGTSSITDGTAASIERRHRQGLRRHRRGACRPGIRSCSSPPPRSPPAFRRWAVRPQNRPRDARTLQAVSAVGQARLMATYNECPRPDRRSRRRARCSWRRSTSWCGGSTSTPGPRSSACSNSASCRSSTRTTPWPTTRSAFGDNDHIAALVAQLMRCRGARAAHRRSGPPHRRSPGRCRPLRSSRTCSRSTTNSRSLAGGTGTNRGSGGMSTKLAAAKIAAWTGVRTVIAAASRPDRGPRCARRRSRASARSCGPRIVGCRPARCGSRSRWRRRGPVARRRGRQGCVAAGRVAPGPGYHRDVDGVVRRRRRRRGPRPRRRGVRQGPGSNGCGPPTLPPRKRGVVIHRTTS